MLSRLQVALCNPGVPPLCGMQLALSQVAVLQSTLWPSVRRASCAAGCFWPQASKPASLSCAQLQRSARCQAVAAPPAEPQSAPKAKAQEGSREFADGWDLASGNGVHEDQAQQSPEKAVYNWEKQFYPVSHSPLCLAGHASRLSRQDGLQFPYVFEKLLCLQRSIDWPPVMPPRSSGWHTAAGPRDVAIRH